MSRGKRAYTSSSRFVLRTPLLPAQALFHATPLSRADARTEIRALLDQPEIDEALLLASPGLHASIREWRKDPDSVKGRKIERSLVKYLVRMSARPTPFGTLSGITAGNVAQTSAFTLLPRATYRRRTRLDNDYLFALSGALTADRDLRERVRVFPNSSLYETAGLLRYAEARLRGTERTYHLVAVEPTDYLLATLARSERGGRVRELAEAIVADDGDVSLDEALDYVHELIDAQLLVPDLGVTITGKEPIDALHDRLEAAGIHAVSRQLGEVRGCLAAMDSQPLGSAIARYGEVAEALSALPAPVEMARLFQVDLLKPAVDVRIGKRLVDEIDRAIAVLHRVAPAGRDPLAAFRRAFAERYEDREVPLVLALDEELGIGFEASSGPGSEGSPLLQGLAFPRAPGSEGEGVSVRLGKRERTLMHLVHHTLSRGAMELVLGEDELSLLDSGAGDADSGKRPLPDAMSAMVRVAAASADAVDSGDFLVYVGGAGGPSGARLLGRFCHLADEVHAMVHDHLRAEEALRPDAVFAEIVHLNEGRIGNVICRPVLRDYEIPYLGISGADEAFRIPIGDLRLSLRRGRLVLRSAALGREVVPRLSTAHNFRLRTMGVYRFLCALQDQGTMSVRWSWGPLETAPFLPRVRCGRAVLARARWLLGTAELAPVSEAARAEGRARTAAELEQGRRAIALAVAALRERLAWPRHVVLAQGDNELPLDLDQPLHVEVLAHELAGQRSAEIIEHFPDPGALCVSGPEGRFASELIVAFHRTADAGIAPGADSGARPPAGAQAERNAPVELPAREPLPGRSAPAVLRRFPPGSAWLYAKLYTGATTADRVLCHAVAPVVRESLAAGDADQWFFVRYADPHPHLRVRFRGEPARLAAHVLPRLEEHIRPLIEAGAVWRVQLDTYEREVERYGGDAGIELAEALFFRDSEAVLAIIGQLEGDEGADARWRLAVRGADMLLDDLGFAPDARQRIFARAREQFGVEFAVTTAMQRQMGERFRAELADLDLLLARDPERDAEHWLKPGFDALAMRSRALAPIAAELRARDLTGALAPSLEDIAWSFVHMHINRLLHDSHRAQELVLYDFLKRYYAGRQARGGALGTAPEALIDSPGNPRGGPR